MRNLDKAAVGELVREIGVLKVAVSELAKLASGSENWSYRKSVVNDILRYLKVKHIMLEE